MVLGSILGRGMEIFLRVRDKQKELFGSPDKGNEIAVLKQNKTLNYYKNEGIRLMFFSTQ